MYYFSYKIAKYISIYSEVKTNFTFKAYNGMFILIQFIYYANTVVPFSPLYSLPPCIPFPTCISPTLSSCPWVIHISSLASPFPILFLTSSCLFCTYHLCFLFPVPLPPFSPSPLITLHIIFISVILLLFQLIAQYVFVFVLGSVVDSCEFVIILCSQF